jgi:hypothetical protein
MKAAPAPTDYLVWPNASPTPYACVLGAFEGFNDFESLWEGRPIKDSFPADVEFVMDPEFPDETVLADCLVNKRNLIVGSERLKNFFEAQELEPTEYLPVAIRDHKGKVAARYYIINPLVALDCLHRKASRAVINDGNPTQVLGVDRVVLREDSVPPGRRFFRISGYPEGIIVRRDLADALKKAGVALPFSKASWPKK